MAPSLRADLVKGRVTESPEYSATVSEVFYRDLRTELLGVAVKAELRRMGIIPIDHEIHAVQKGEDELRLKTTCHVDLCCPRAKLIASSKQA